MPQLTIGSTSGIYKNILNNQKKKNLYTPFNALHLRFPKRMPNMPTAQSRDNTQRQDENSINLTMPV